MTTPPPPPAALPAAIRCETAVRRLWDHLDGRLPATARVEVEAHLATCHECPSHFDFAARTLAALATARPPASSDDDEALRVRVRAAVQGAA